MMPTVTVIQGTWVVLLAALSVAQAALLLVTTGGMTRAIGVIMAVATCNVAGVRMSPRTKIEALVALALVSCLNFVWHLSAISPQLPYRFAHLSVVVLHGALALGGLLIVARALRPGRTLAIVLSLAAAVIAVDVLLERSIRSPLAWVGGAAPHPLLGQHYVGGSYAESVYPDNPRGYFRRSGERLRWALALHDRGSVATLERDDVRMQRLRIHIEQAENPAAFNIQLNQPNLAVRRGVTYALTFRARADRLRQMSYGVSMGQAPWEGLGFYREIDVGPEWDEVAQTFELASSHDNARLHFDLGESDASVELEDVVLSAMPSGRAVHPATVGPGYSVSYRFNDLGCRGDNRPIRREPHVRRILVLGDSYALGVGVHEPHTFAARLENALNASRPVVDVTRYEVLNCSVDGYGTRQQRLFYDLFGVIYQPDVILVAMTSTDNAPAHDEAQQIYGRERNQFDRLFVAAEALHRIRHRFRRTFDYSASGAELVQLVESARAGHARLGVVVFRTSVARPWDDLIAAVSSDLVRRNVPVLDLGESLLRDQTPGLLAVHPADQRPNEIAHRIAAEEISRFLVESGLLERFDTPLPTAERQSDPDRVERERSGWDGRFLVIAHRGNSVVYPENTLPAIESAFEVGADVVEIDVRLTRDGVPVVFHSETLERTTNGRGRVLDHTLKEIKALDAGGWKHSRFAGVSVPTLEEAVRVARGRGRLLLDVKSDGLAGPVADVYARLNVSPHEAFIGAWTAGQRAEFAHFMPEARILKAEPAPMSWSPDLFAELRRQGVWGFELSMEQWHRPFARDAATHGFPVIVYTVNSVVEMRRFIEAGVSGIETDDPRLLLDVATRLGVR